MRTEKTVNATQRTLSADRVAEFYHDHFVADQVTDFVALAAPALPKGAVVADVGGGCGFFARALSQRVAVQVRVLDTDPVSVETCHQHGVQAQRSDALAPDITGDEQVVCFNLILHHLVGASGMQTTDMQRRALAAWHGSTPRVFVNEYIYESYGAEKLSAWLIWAITSSKVLSLIARAVSRWVPSLRANTFGVGVRFRSAADWHAMFASTGYEVIASQRGHDEPVSLARRLMLIRSCRRDSFLLRAAGTP